MHTSRACYSLACDSCPIHLATKEKDLSHQKALRISIAEEINRIYGMTLQPDEINDCDGCRTDTGRLFFGCLNCEIRKCACSREIENCAHCIDYACDNLEKFLEKESQAKLRLDKIRYLIKSS